MPEKITIHFAGVDDWSRVVFKGDNGRFYKIATLNPKEGFEALSPEEQCAFIQDLHTCGGEFEGEPCSPCNLEHFILVG